MILLRHLRTRQPPCPAARLAPDVADAWSVFLGTAGTANLGTAGGFFAVSNPSAFAFAPSVHGAGGGFGSYTDGRLTSKTLDGATLAWPGITIVAAGISPVLSSGQGPPIIAICPYADYYGVGSLLIGNTSGNRTFYWRAGNNTSYITHSGYNTAPATNLFNDGDPYVVVARFDKTTLSLWIATPGGISKSSNAHAYGWRSGTHSTNFAGYWYPSAYRAHAAPIALAAAIPRALSDARADELLRNPWSLFAPIERRIWVPVSAAGGGDVSVNLTGASSTLSAGSLSSAVAQSVSGAAVTLSTGTLVSAVEQALSGAVGTFSAGTITAAAAYTLAGQAATAAAGTIIPAVEQPLTGAAITSAQGSISTSAGGDVSVNLSGQALTASHGTLAGTVDYNLSGVAVTAAAGTLDVSVAQVLSGLSIASAAGTITHTGGDSATYSILPPYITVYFWRRTA